MNEPQTAQLATSDASRPKDTLNLLHLTDFHLFADQARSLASVNTYNTFSSVLEDVVSRRQHIFPDAILVTGDISQDYSEESYRAAYQMLRETFGERVPIFATCGNHEEPTHFARYFGASSQIVDEVDGFSGWRLIVLNSQLPEKVPGRLDEAMLALLDRGLANCDKPTMLIMHHHLLPVNCRWLDNINLLNHQAVIERLAHAPQVKLVVSGHVHQESSSYSGGVSYLTTPATGWQFAINHDEFKLGTMMPGYRWIRLKTDGEFFSVVQRVAYRADFVPEQIAGY